MEYTPPFVRRDAEQSDPDLSARALGRQAVAPPVPTASLQLEPTNMNARITMKTITLLVSLIATVAVAQDAKKTEPGTEIKPKETPAMVSAEKSRPNTEELEAQFKAALTKATLSGRWCGIKDGKLTPEKEDKYTIV